MKKVGHLHINWFGGEPLLQLKKLKHMSRQLKTEADNCGCAFSQFITTNGFMITRLVAKELSEIGIKNVQITLDGDKKSHDRLRVLASGAGTYKKVLSACKYVVESGMELLIRINVNKWNVNHINGLLLDLVSNGVSPTNAVIHATRAVNHGNSSDAMSTAFYSTKEFAKAWIEILETISKHGFNLPTLAPIAYNCPFDLEQTVMIGYDDSIRHCSSSDKIIADLTEAGDDTNHRNLYHVVKERTPLDDPQCRKCLYLPMCMGGCSYLEEIGEEKCMPEKYILPQLVLLTARQANFKL